MCIFSACAQIVYGVAMGACIVFTGIALFTPAWGQKNGENEGLMPWTCVTDHGNDCSNWWKTIPDWQRATAVLMCIALALECIAFIWNIIAFFACCCKRFIIYPLAPLALFSFLCLLAAVITFGISDKNASQTGSKDTPMGWSFWMAVTATAIAGAEVIVGAVAVTCGKSCL